MVSAGEVLALPLWLTERLALEHLPAAGRSGAAVESERSRRHRRPAQRRRDRRYGAPVAYNIRKTHPGDIRSASSFGGQWERIPAYLPFGRQRVIHLFDAERIGQNRGKPIVAAVARMFNSFDKLMFEKLRVAVLDAMIFAAIETPLDQESMAELVGGDKRADFEATLKEWRVQMRGGAMIPLPPGTKMNAFAPTRGTSELESFATLMLRHIATGLNMPYELVFKDFSKTNYSSARAALLEAGAISQLPADDPTAGQRRSMSSGSRKRSTPATSRTARRRISTRTASPGPRPNGSAPAAAGSIRSRKRPPRSCGCRPASRRSRTRCAEQGRDWRECSSSAPASSLHARARRRAADLAHHARPLRCARAG
jgi:hypothetical protein